MPSQSQGRIFYGWWIVATVLFAEMFAMGSTAYAFGLFIVPVSEEFGLTRAAANTGLILMMVGVGLAAPVVGRLLDRFPARNVLTGGALCTGAGFFMVALASEAWQIALALILPIGCGVAAIGPQAAATIVSRWFNRQRGRALGITAVGTSVGGALVVPIMGFNLEMLGWRETLAIQGVLISVLVSGTALIFVRDCPGDMGLVCDGDAGLASGSKSVVRESRWSYAQMLQNHDFWLIGISIALIFGVSQGVMVSLVPYANDRGVSSSQAAFLISLMAAGSILGKVIIGAIADWLDKRWLLLGITCFEFLKLAVLLAEPDYMFLLVMFTIVGITTSGELPVWGALVADRFGSLSYGSVMGAMYFMGVLASITAVRYVGEVYDRTGDYLFAYWTFIVIITVSVACLLMIKQVKAAPQAG